MSDPNAHTTPLPPEGQSQDPSIALFEEARICAAEILGETGGGDGESTKIVTKGVTDLVKAVLAATRAGLPTETIHVLVEGACADPAPYNDETESYR